MTDTLPTAMLPPTELPPSAQEKAPVQSILSSPPQEAQPAGSTPPTPTPLAPKTHAPAAASSLTNISNPSLTSISSSTSTASTCSSPRPLTPSQHPSYHCQIPQLDPRTGAPLSVLQRTYVPEADLTVEEGLARGPVPGRYRVFARAKERSEEERRAEFEEVKRKLRGLK